jgi:hypothetical protein
VKYWVNGRYHVYGWLRVYAGVHFVSTAFEIKTVPELHDFYEKGLQLQFSVGLQLGK